MAAKSPAQANPAATTDTDLFTATGATVCSTLVICNQSSSASATYQVRVRVAGAANANKQFIVKDKALAASQVDCLTLGLTLANTDVVTVQASTANVSFNLFMDA